MILSLHNYLIYVKTDVPHLGAVVMFHILIACLVLGDALCLISYLQGLMYFSFKTYYHTLYKQEGNAGKILLKTYPSCDLLM